MYFTYSEIFIYTFIKIHFSTKLFIMDIGIVSYDNIIIFILNCLDFTNLIVIHKFGLTFTFFSILLLFEN